MKKSYLAIAAVIALILIGAVAYLGLNLKQAKTEKAEMQELMELDRMEMENEYRGFTLQYDELRNTIQNDTLAQQLNAERQRAQQLLEELQRVKANDANYVAEIKRLRVERHVENALKVVDFLAKHPKVAKVNHPALESHHDHQLYKKYFPNGGASIFTFEIKGGQEEAWKFIDALQIFSLLANVADVKSLVIHPYTTTHSQLSPEELAEQHITPSTVRLSIGTEHIDDIIDDLAQALDKI